MSEVCPSVGLLVGVGIPDREAGRFFFSDIDLSSFDLIALLTVSGREESDLCKIGALGVLPPLGGVDPEPEFDVLQWHVEGDEASSQGYRNVGDRDDFCTRHFGIGCDVGNRTGPVRLDAVLEVRLGHREASHDGHIELCFRDYRFLEHFSLRLCRFHGGFFRSIVSSEIAAGDRDREQHQAKHDCHLEGPVPDFADQIHFWSFAIMGTYVPGIAAPD